MKAIVTRVTGSTPVMNIESRDIPQKRDGTSLVRIHRASINQLSNTIRTGAFGDTPLPLVLGNEGAGIIEESDIFPRGTRVAVYGGGQLGITEDGMFQEWVVVDNRRIMALPDSITLDEGAALTVNYLTAWHALNRIARVQAGETVLISGSTGSVGHALVQTARVANARVIALVSSDEKARQAREAGAHFVINWQHGNVVEDVMALTEGKRADVAFDPVGGHLFSLLLASLRRRGQLISIGFTGGKEASVNLLDIIGREKSVKGYALHSDTPEQDSEGLEQLMVLAAQGHLRPVIDSIYKPGELEAGYQRLLSRQATGSVILNLGD
jgi:NADPH:quinone reductase and related Zn-dependent oxidoreductases